MTRNITKILFMALAFLQSQDAWSEASSVTIFERRFFSASVLGGYSESRILNSDASFSSFSGTNYGAEVGFRLVSFEKADLQLFGKYLSHRNTGRTSSSDRLSFDQTQLGLKAYLGNYVFLGFGYGNGLLKIKTSVDDFTVTAPGSSLGFGFDYKISPSLSFGFSAWYSNGVITYQSPLTSNSYIDNAAIQMNLTWSPLEISKVMGGTSK